MNEAYHLGQNAALREDIPLALYLHYPYCLRKCSYCDFNSHVLLHDHAACNQSYLCDLQKDLLEDCVFAAGRRIQSIFIGGGTPSLLTGAQVADLLEMICRSCDLAEDCEITLEANPSSAEAVHFADYRAAGVNRLSLGVQSFDDACLQALGRLHDAACAKSAVRMAQTAGFERINLDVMFGLPRQSRRMAQRDLEAALACEVEHISRYQLSIEPHTAFAHQPPPLPDEDTIAAMQDEGGELLRAHSFEQYEVSAWSRGAPCRHNLNYWRFGDYLGIGAGAHGKITLDDGRILRYRKQSLPKNYHLQALAAANWVAKKDQAFEFMLNALRLRAGVPRHLLAERTALREEDLAEIVQDLEKQELLEKDCTRFVCTPHGFLYLNDVLLRFLPRTLPLAGQK